VEGGGEKGARSEDVFEKFLHTKSP
jgi:hypothetical protein